MDHTGSRVMFSFVGSEGGWIGGPKTTDGLIVLIEKGGLNSSLNLQTALSAAVFEAM